MPHRELLWGGPVGGCLWGETTVPASHGEGASCPLRDPQLQDTGVGQTNSEEAKAWTSHRDYGKTPYLFLPHRNALLKAIPPPAPEPGKGEVACLAEAVGRAPDPATPLRVTLWTVLMSREAPCRGSGFLSH